MRIPSSKTDISIYFVAVDATDHVTRETGLSSFTVYRSRNGAAEVAYTTPTVAEIDTTNMPGVYALLVDEDTTIASGSDSEEYCVHITHAGMAPVTRTIELYRRDTTSGRTLDVSAGGEAGIDWANVGSPTTTLNLSGTTVKTATDVETDTADIQSRLPAALVSGRIDASVGAMAANTLTATAIAADAITAAKVADGTIDAATFASGAITAAAIAADAITDAKVASDVTIASVTGAVGSVTGNVGGNVVGSVGSVAGLTTAGVADAVWDEARAGHVTVGTFGEVLESGDIADAVLDDSRYTDATADIDAIITSLGTLAGDVADTITLSDTVEGSVTVLHALRIMLAMLAGKASGFPAGPFVFRDTPDTKNRVSITAGAEIGDRATVTLDPS